MNRTHTNLTRSSATDRSKARVNRLLRRFCATSPSVLVSKTLVLHSSSSLVPSFNKTHRCFISIRVVSAQSNYDGPTTEHALHVYCWCSRSRNLKLISRETDTPLSEQRLLRPRNFHFAIITRTTLDFIGFPFIRKGT